MATRRSSGADTSRNRQKGSEKRKRERSDRVLYSKFVPDVSAPRVEDRSGKKKATPPNAKRVKKTPSGRGISGSGIHITGKKATSRDRLSGGRAKPTRKASA